MGKVINMHAHMVHRQQTHSLISLYYASVLEIALAIFTFVHAFELTATTGRKEELIRCWWSEINVQGQCDPINNLVCYKIQTVAHANISHKCLLI